MMSKAFKSLNVSQSQLIQLLELADIIFPGQWYLSAYNDELNYLSYKECDSSEKITIHWLEFCMYYVYPYLFERIKWDPERKDYDFFEKVDFHTDADIYYNYSEFDYQSFAECFIMNHPVDYLYARYTNISENLT